MIVCGNGLGHLRRAATVVSSLIQRCDTCRVDVVCARRQVKQLTHWQVLKELTSGKRTTFKYLDLYPRWDPAYRDRRLLTWHTSLSTLELKRYDLVISDNLVEVLYYQPETVLSGSFLWHDLYERAYPETLLFREYARRSKALLRDHRPPMIANRYFAMPAVREQTQTIEVGMLPLVSVGRSKRQNRVLDILFAGGSQREVAEAMGGYLDGLASAGAMGPSVRLWMDRRVAKIVKDLPSVHLFDYDRQDFSSVDAVVARPGMGVITDCIATGTPLFCVYEANPEMEHNAAVLARLGLGWPLRSIQEALDHIVGWYHTPGAYQTYRACVERIDKQGLQQTGDFLLARLGLERSPTN